MRRAIFCLIVVLLLAGCTRSDPDQDPDGDAVDTQTEEQGKVIEISLLDRIERRQITSDPRQKDTDGDGLEDGDEHARGSDPRDVDTDDDGLLDGDDAVARDDATRAAWTAAAILEVNGTFLGELDACPPGGPQLRPNAASSDLPLADGLLDGEELRGWDITVRGATFHVASNPCEYDTDADGLPDHLERELLSDPRDEDTDGDSVRDGLDADPTADLALSFGNITVTRDNATPVRLVAAAGVHEQSFTTGSGADLVLEVSDQSTRDTLPVGVVLRAEDAETGAPVALFDDPRGVVLTFDLLRGTVEGTEAEGRLLRFAGEDGALAFEWTVARR